MDPREEITDDFEFKPVKDNNDSITKEVDDGNNVSGSSKFFFRAEEDVTKRVNYGTIVRSSKTFVSAPEVVEMSKIQRGLEDMCKEEILYEQKR